MNKFYLYYDPQTRSFEGFYEDKLEDSVLDYLVISEDLWKHILSIPENFTISTKLINKEIYTIEDVNIIEFIETPQLEIGNSPFENIDKNNALAMLDLANKDIRLKELEKQNAQGMLDNANKDIEMKNLQNDLANLVLEVAKGGVV